MTCPCHWWGSQVVLCGHRERGRGDGELVCSSWSCLGTSPSLSPSRVPPAATTWPSHVTGLTAARPEHLGVRRGRRKAWGREMLHRVTGDRGGPSPRRAASHPCADPRRRRSQPSPHVFRALLRFFPSPRGQAACSVFPSAGAEGALKTRWVRIKRLFVQPVGVTALPCRVPPPPPPSRLSFSGRPAPCVALRRVGCRQRGRHRAPFLVGLGGGGEGRRRRGGDAEGRKSS